MPRSKRAKVVHLTKVEKKGKELSQRLFAAVRDAADRCQYIFLFSVENMRNNYLKDVRTEFADSRYALARLFSTGPYLGSWSADCALARHSSNEKLNVFDPVPTDSF